MCGGATVTLDEAFHRRLLGVRDVLAYSFDFEVLAVPLDASGFASPSPWLPAFVVSEADCLVVARDALGGVFVLCQFGVGEQCCLHVDTQGHSVVVGKTLNEAVSLVLELPYWRELLTESAGELDQMRQAALRLEADVAEEFPAIPAAREDLKATLGLTPLADPVHYLYELAIATAAPVAVVSPHGWQYQSLV